MALPGVICFFFCMFSMTHSLRVAMASPGPRKFRVGRNCRHARRRPRRAHGPYHRRLLAPYLSGEITNNRAVRTKMRRPGYSSGGKHCPLVGVKRNSVVHDDQRKWSIAEMAAPHRQAPARENGSAHHLLLDPCRRSGFVSPKPGGQAAEQLSLQKENLQKALRHVLLLQLQKFNAGYGRGGLGLT